MKHRVYRNKQRKHGLRASMNRLKASVRATSRNVMSLALTNDSASSTR